MAQFYTLEEAARVLGMSAPGFEETRLSRARCARSLTVARGDSASLTSTSWRDDGDSGATPSFGCPTFDKPATPPGSSGEFRNWTLSESPRGSQARPGGGIRTSFEGQGFRWRQTQRRYCVRPRHPARRLALPPSQISGSSSVIIKGPILG